MQTAFQFLECTLRDGIARVTLNRPDRRNALSLELMHELIACFERLGTLPDVRVVVLAANGPAFSAGHDLRELRARDDVAYREIFDVCVTLMSLIQKIPQPVIAEVDGIATAAGCQLVASCDLAIASSSAHFATPGVKIGLFCSTPMVALSRAIGRKRALEMLLTGEMIDAQTACAWGLVNRVVDPAELRATVEVLAAKIATASGAVIATGKETFYAQVELDQRAAYALTAQVMSENAGEDDAQEGIAAFIERRMPQWPTEIQKNR